MEEVVADVISRLDEVADPDRIKAARKYYPTVMNPAQSGEEGAERIIEKKTRFYRKKPGK